MGKYAWVVAMLTGLTVAEPAWAQRPIRQTINVPIDTRGAILPFPEGQLTNPVPDSFLSFFTRIFSSPIPIASRQPTRSNAFRGNATRPFGVFGN